MKHTSHASVHNYKDGKVVWFHNGKLPRAAEQVIFARLYFRMVGNG